MEPITYAVQVVSDLLGNRTAQIHIASRVWSCGADATTMCLEIRRTFTFLATPGAARAVLPGAPYNSLRSILARGVIGANKYFCAECLLAADEEGGAEPARIETEAPKSGRTVAKKKKIKGLHTHRFRDNLEEKRFAEKWAEVNDQGHTLAYLLQAGSQTGRPVEPDERERVVASTVVQWLGSPLGQVFLREMGWEKRGK